MKVRIIHILVFICLLTGCAKTEKPSTEEAQEIVVQKYDEYRQVYYTVWGGALMPEIEIIDGVCNRPELIKYVQEYDDYLFLKVEDDKFQSTADIKTALESVCTKEFAEAQYKQYMPEDTMSPLYCDIDGELYIGLWDGTVNYDDIAQIEIVKQTADIIEASVTTEPGFGTGLTSNYFIRLKEDKGEWYIDHIE